MMVWPISKAVLAVTCLSLPALFESHAANQKLRWSDGEPSGSSFLSNSEGRLSDVNVPKPDDRTRARAISRAIRDSGRIRDYRIGVKCVGETLIVKGVVSNVTQMSTVYDILAAFDDVTEVISQLKVGEVPKGEWDENIPQIRVLPPL